MGMQQELTRLSGTRMNLTEKELMMLVRLQALVRGFIRRRQYKVKIIESNKANVVYFKREELMETVKGNNNVYDPS